MAKANLTKEANISVTAREIDFVSRFGNNWQALIDIIGISRPIKKELGSVLKSKVGAVTLQSGSVGEGESIPYSLASVVEKTYAEITLEKYKKAVSAEAIKTNGYDVAVAKTDDAFLSQLQNVILGKYYTFLNSGLLTNVQTSFQLGLAYAKGLVLDKFDKLQKDVTEVVGFCNILDFYHYLGGASITVQSQFGLNYVKDFMGYRVLFLLSDKYIAKNRIIATPVENIVSYYVDPADSDFARAGLNFTVDGVTNFLGFHTEGNYDTLVSECTALMGIELFAEYLDGIAVVKVEASGSKGSLSVTSVAGTAVGDTKLTCAILDNKNALYYAYGDSAISVNYLQEFNPDSWSAFVTDKDYTIANGKVVTIIEVNGSGQIVAEGHQTVVSKTQG